MEFGDFIVYVDESGDHGLEQINPENPVFVLAFCIFNKRTYGNQIVPSAIRLKFRYWGHDGVVLHSRDIRKQQGDFRMLRNPKLRPKFLARLSQFIADAEFTLVAAAIDKKRLADQYAYPANPYALALEFCLERLQRFLSEHGQDQTMTFLVVERRGKPEDESLELTFRRVCAGRGSYAGPMPNLDIRFMDKKHNSTGLQIADLVAYPVARHTIAPDQPNRAYEIVEPKFRRSNTGRILGYGLKIFP